MANPLTPPNLLPTSGPRALVIGAGVSGLTTARCLQQRGFAVTVIADRFQSATTSVVAGALWEWPPAVCGYYELQPEESLRAEQRWCVESYNCFKVLAQQPTTGVYLRPVIFYLETPAEENPLELRKMRELREHVGDSSTAPSWPPGRGSIRHLPSSMPTPTKRHSWTPTST